MWTFSKSLVIFLLVAYSTLLVIQPGECRARADWDDDDDWDSSFPDSNEDEEEPANPSKSDSEDHSHHQIQTAGVLGGGSGGGSSAGDTGKQLAGAQGANYAAFNESCSPTGKRCHTNDNLVCSATDGTGRCACSDGYVYVRHTETCWIIPRSNEEACGHDVQCHTGRWGNLSRCSKVSARCECYDYQTNGRRNTTNVDGICYIQKGRGDLCNADEECDIPMGGGAYCEQGDHQSSGGQSYTGSCQCKDTHTWYNPLQQCLPLATQRGDSCKVTDQCRKGSLGRWSLCVKETAKCDCSPLTEPFSGEKNETREVVYYEKLKKCFLKKEYNETCEEADECRASLGPDVECGPNDPERPNESICYCPQGRVCRSSAFSVLKASTSVMAWATTAAVTGVMAYANGVCEGVGV